MVNLILNFFLSYCFCVISVSAVSSFRIRDVKITDIDKCVDLVKQLGYEIPKDYFIHYFPKFKEGNIDKVFVVANDANAIGIAHIHFREFSKRCTLEAIVVDKEFRGKGIGKLLILAAEQYALSRGATILEFISSNERKNEAHLFYTKLGYSDNNKTYFQKQLGS